MKIEMLIASHKQYEMPTDNKIYLPIFVGSALHKDGYSEEFSVRCDWG